MVSPWFVDRLLFQRSHLVIPMGVYVLIPSLIRAPVWAGELAKALKARLTTAISRVAVMLDQDLA